MKKLHALILSLILIASFGTAAVADEDWDSFVARMKQQEMIKTEGAAYLEQLAAMVPNADYIGLWQISCSAPSLKDRAAAGYALVLNLFPNGDPARWQEVQGFFPPGSYVPAQIVAVNALFNTVIALTQMPEGKYSAAFLMKRFSQSARGMLIFIETTPAVFRETLDTLIAETGLDGDWTTKKVEGIYPFVPVYNGMRTEQFAVTNKLIFLNGYGGVAQNGPFAWDKLRGYVYRIVAPDAFYLRWRR